MSIICYPYCVMYKNNTKTDRNKQLISLREKGFSYGAIAIIFNLSRQRVHQITSGYHTINQSLHHEGKRTNSQTFYLTEIRRIIFERDNNSCQRCGVDKHLLIHHLDNNDRNNDLTNLIVLCSQCHLDLHRPSNAEVNQGDINIMESKEIQQLRKQLGLTQKEFAGRLGLDAISISRWERGEQRPRAVHLRRMARLSKKVRDKG